MAHYIGTSSVWAWQFLKAFYACDRSGLERSVRIGDRKSLIKIDQDVKY